MEPGEPCPTKIIAARPGGKLLPAANLLYNNTYGNYLAASSQIKPGELIYEEVPIICGPLGTPSSTLPWHKLIPHNFKAVQICLSCGKPLQVPATCTKCHWPICSKACENDPLHSEGECPIFVEHQVLPEMLTLENCTAITVLRTLLFLVKNPFKWEFIQKLESHLEGRLNCSIDREKLNFIVNFIHVKCKWTQFEIEKIDHVLGCWSTNAFWSYPDVDRHVYVLYEKGCFLIHDCDPNTDYKIVEQETVVDGVKQNVLMFQVHAIKVIQPDEPITIPYILTCNDSSSVIERQQYLLDYFNFECRCNRCIKELKEINCINNNTIKK